jgi:hypothetical protein
MMPATRRERPRGLSLVETIIGLAIFLVVLLALYTLFDSSNAIYQSGRRKTNVHQNARTAMEEISGRIRMAGYFGENFVPGSTTTLTGGVQMAGPNGLGIYGTFETPANPAAPVSEVYFFCCYQCFPTGDRTLRLQQGGTGDVYTCTDDDEILARNVDAFNLAYVLGDGTVTAGPLTAAQLSALRAIRIVLRTREDVRNATDQAQVLTLSTTIALRNFILTP